MDGSTRFVLRDDVTVMPVADVDESVAAELDCGPEDFVVTQSGGRVSSVLVDADTADLLRGFADEKTLAEAVIRFSQPRRLDPGEVLEETLPLVERFVRQGFLIDAADPVAREASRQSLGSGDRLDGATVVRPLQILDDCELYQVRYGSGFAALKLHRAIGAGAAAAPLDHEAAILRHLGGEVAPRLLGRGEIAESPFLLLEWCDGVSSQAAAAEWRRGGSGGRGALLNLCRCLVRAYARLHELGVIHGDVHPRNVLVGREGDARLVDFGLAQLKSDSSDPVGHSRPGVPLYFEPEHARSMLERHRPLPVSETGEQFAVAALAYYLVTGAHYSDFGLEREDLFRRIAEAQPVAFADRGLSPWPRLEAVLRRALAKAPDERFPSMEAFAATLDALPEETAPKPSARRAPARATDDFLRAAALDGPWLRDGLALAPTASVYYGAAGIACALYRIACQRDDPATLTLAEVWARRAERQVGRPEGFYNAEQDLGRERLGEITPYHTASGVYVVQAMIAHARIDFGARAAAVDGFVAASQPSAKSFDLTLGRSGTLVAGALLTDLQMDDAVSNLGRRTLADLWRELDARPTIAEDVDEYLGLAHGWAGFLYATLHWCRSTGEVPPSGLERRLTELAVLGEPTGRGLRWRWQAGGRAEYMPGWCHGSAGYVFLWSAAAHLLKDPSFEELALGAAWDVWDAPDLHSTLCCGLAGRAYALLRVHNDTGDRRWLDRACHLARCAAREHRFVPEYPHSLYKGEIVLAVLDADLERPAASVMPFFEEEGWPRTPS